MALASVAFLGVLPIVMLLSPPRVAALPAVKSDKPAVPAKRALSRPTPRVPTWRQVTAAHRFARARRGLVSFAVIDTKGRLHCHDCRRRHVAASLVKAMLLVAYLNRVHAGRGPLTGSERALLGAMIRVSDNDAADTIYARVGDDGLYRLARRVGMQSFDAYGYWSSARLTAADQARFFLLLDRVTPPPFRAYARALLSSIVGWQGWGIPEAARPRWRTYFKGGWRPSSPGRLVHQAALLERGRLRLAIAVLTDRNPCHDYGVATVRGVAERLLRVAPAGNARRGGGRTSSRSSRSTTRRPWRIRCSRRSRRSREPGKRKRTSWYQSRSASLHTVPPDAGFRSCADIFESRSRWRDE